MLDIADVVFDGGIVAFDGGIVTLNGGIVAVYLGIYYRICGILLQKRRKNFPITYPVMSAFADVGVGWAVHRVDYF
jgi:hypothetical protein